MSMLSAQCDRLRKMAELVEGHGKVGFGDLIITDPLMVDAAKELRDAADTIWSLRCDCVELREQLNITDESRHFADTRARELFAKNAKLRELCADMLMCLTWQDEPHGYMMDGCDCCRFRGKTNGACGLGAFRGRAADLGVEVPE